MRKTELFFAMTGAYVASIEAQRKAKDDAFRHEPWSPIEDRKAFRGLAYYPVDPAYCVPARLIPHAVPKVLDMQTSDGQTRHYANVGEFHLKLPVGDVTLQAYRSPGQGGLFIPFRDKTSGKETYGAGRYLDVHLENDADEAIVDLNLAYNPYCAYSEAFSCPFPPPENWLQVPIRAGERHDEMG